MKQINWSFVLGIVLFGSFSRSAAASIYSEDWRTPRGYVVVCKTAGGQTVEPYLLHEARYQYGFTAYNPDPQLKYEAIIREVFERFRPRSGYRIDSFQESVKKTIELLRIEPMSGASPEPGEVYPSPLAPECQVKKVLFWRYSGNSPQFVVDASLWNSLSELGKAAVLIDETLQRCRDGFGGYSEFLINNDEVVRHYTALMFWSQVNQISDRDWFSLLGDMGAKWVLFNGYSVQTENATFYPGTKSLESAHVTDSASLTIGDARVGLKGTLFFYPSGKVHRAQTKLSSGVPILGIKVWLDADKEIEFAENGTVLQAWIRSFSDAAQTDQWLLRFDGPITFYPAGLVKSITGTGAVELSGRIIEVKSEAEPMHFDEAGFILNGVLAHSVKLYMGGAVYELAARAFTSSKNHLKSAFLATEARAVDCKGLVRTYPAGVEVHFNEVGVPCEESI